MSGEGDLNFLNEVLAELSHPLAPPTEIEHNRCASATSSHNEPMGDESEVNGTGHCSEPLQGRTVKPRKECKDTTTNDQLEAETDMEVDKITAEADDENVPDNSTDADQPTNVNMLSIEDVSKHSRINSNKILH